MFLLIQLATYTLNLKSSYNHNSQPFLNVILGQVTLSYPLQPLLILHILDVCYGGSLLHCYGEEGAENPKCELCGMG